MKRKLFVIACLVLAMAAASLAQTDVPQRGQRGGSGVQAPQTPPVAPTDLRPLLAPRQSEMRLVQQRYEADRDQLSRFYRAVSPVRFARLKRFDLDWAAALDGLKAGGLSPAAKKDLETLRNAVLANSKKIDADAAAAGQIAPLLPFGSTIARLEEARMRMDTISAEASAIALSQAADLIGPIQARVEAGIADPSKREGLPFAKDALIRAAESIGAMRTILKDWFNFYNEFDPLFTWWMAQPYKQADKALEDYAAILRDKAAPASGDTVLPPAPPVEIVPAPAPQTPEVPDLAELLSYPQDEMRAVVQQYRGSGRGLGGSGAGAPPAPDKKYYTDWLAALKKLDFGKLSRDGQIDYLFLRNAIESKIRKLGLPPSTVPRKPDASGIPGQPIGREALMAGLAEELIPYTPEQLIALGEKQYAWCETEMKKAAREMGCGDDWKAAIEKAKKMHVPPGGQPDVIRDLMLQAADYLRAKDLITVPEIERETLRMEMMSASRQLVNPFFTGGALIRVSYPTSTMTTRQKLESMRGNNLPFSHATAFHEMIPGHNMQDYMSRRFGPSQSNLGTSFWGEGWPVYWETLLYDRGFDDTPELRVGALFWRMHRCARIVFSLKFHLGEWSPQECIDYLVDKVGHERENATAEVRRSFGGGYGPLYQAAYLLGALQMRELRKEFVDSGLMTDKRFHDAVIRKGSLPIALLRLWLGRQKLTKDLPLDWKCFGN
jgi:hypothetical protein